MKPIGGYLDDVPVRAMSNLTQAILSTIDDERACRRRQTNFAVLDAALGADNLFPVRFQGRPFARAGDVIPLPIDQRYGEEDMNRILEVVGE